MEAPPLVEVEDLACSPAGSLETGSPSVYSELGTASSPSEASPVDITSQKPVLLRASREAPYVGLGAYTKRAAEAAEEAQAKVLAEQLYHERKEKFLLR